MSGIPAIPPGFELEGEPPRRDPWDILRAEGWTATNGYRTSADTARIRRQGFTPAEHSRHLEGDAVDLDNPRLSRAQQVARLHELFGDWPNARIIDEGHHRHLQLPGWGAAPGTPGTPNSGLPQIPEGFNLVQRGPLSEGNFVRNAPPPAAPAPTPSRPPLIQWQAPPAPPEPARHFTSEGTPASHQFQAPTTATGPITDPDARLQFVTTRSDPARAGVNARFRAMYADPQVTNAQLATYLAEHGISPATIPNWGEAMRWRNSPAFAQWRHAPASQRRGQVVNLDDISIPDADQGEVVVSARRLPPPSSVSVGRDFRQAQASTWHPNFSERIAEGVRRVEEPTLGRSTALQTSRSTQDLLGWTSVGDLDATRQYSDAEQRAMIEGRPLDAAGNHLGGMISAAGLIPGVGLGIREGRRIGEGAFRSARRGIANWLRRGERAAAVEGAESLATSASPMALSVGGAGGPDAPLPAIRIPDRIDVRDGPPVPPGFQLEDPLGRVHPLGERPSPATMAEVTRSIRPEDVTPIPGNRVETAEEAARANPGTIRDASVPRPRLAMRPLPSATNPAETVNHRGPLDAEAFLRRNGGVRDEGGELRHMGITNAPRPESPGDRVLGPLISPDGMTPDEAAERLWEAGYLPGHVERPDIETLHDVLRSSRNGYRTWHPDDFGEIADHEAAVAAHHASENAAQEGSPLAERIGDAANLADLQQNNPPATAYEDLPRIGGRVANINLANIASDTDIRRLLQNTEDRFGGFNAARRGVVSHAETEALASELGMSADDLLRRRPGQALNAEQALAARQLLARSSDEVLALARRAMGPEASDVSRAAFSEALLRHAAIHEQVTGATAEAGRALSAMRIAAHSRAVSDDIHAAAIQGAGGQRRLEDIAQRILDLHDQGVGPGGVNRFAANAVKPRFRDKLTELWINSLLSGPQTHAVNILSNSLTAALQLPEQAVAAGLGHARRGVRRLLGKEDDFDQVMFSEIGPRLVGLMQGARDGLRAGGRAFMTGEVDDFVTKVESRTHRAIGGPVGSVVRTPTRALAAEDEFFKAIASRMELNGLAVRQARKEGLRGDALRERVADLAAHPTDDMLAQSADYARYLTFQRPLPHGGFAQSVSNLTQRHAWLKLFIPFVRTPTNILKFAAERSPMGLIMRQVRDDLKAGGARRALALSRMALGTGLGLTVAELASRGIITGGGPADRGAEDLMRADGWQPYSVRIGDQYYSYARLDPLATTLGVAADMVDVSRHMTDSQAEQAGALVVASIIRNLGNKTWLSGTSDLLQAVDDPQRYLGPFLARLAGSIAVPAIVGQTARTLDPVQRDTSEPIGGGENLPAILRRPLATIESRIPGLSEQLPARRDVFGEEMRNEGGLGPDMISPIWTRQAHNDPVIGNLLDAEINIGRPSRRVGGRRLSASEYGRYQEMSGRYIREDLTAAMADPSWERMSAPERRSTVERIKRQARRDARADLAVEAPPMPPGFELAH